MILICIGLDNALLPDGTKPLPEPVLTGHQWGLVAFTWGWNVHDIYPWYEKITNLRLHLHLLDTNELNHWYCIHSHIFVFSFSFQFSRQPHQHQLAGNIFTQQAGWERYYFYLWSFSDSVYIYLCTRVELKRISIIITIPNSRLVFQSAAVGAQRRANQRYRIGPHICTAWIISQGISMVIIQKYSHVLNP